MLIRKILSIILAVCFLFSTEVIIKPAFCATEGGEYLCEFGIAFYRMGRLDDALHEFNKVLMLDPANKTARKYINEIFQKERPPEKQIVTNQPVRRLTRDETINQSFRDLAKKETKPELEKKKSTIAGIKISGEAQLRLGVTSEDTIWKRANWDLNEKNFRMLSTTAFDRKENTFDPRIYDRLRINLDTGEKEGFGFHTNITVDPWSFTGKSSKFTVSHDGDSAQIELKYWSNTGYTINEVVNTLRNGDSLALPEIKVVNGKIQTPLSVKSSFNNTFTLPEVKIYREFQPLREMLLDYKQDDLRLNVFPIAYENQALTFDDPLRLSNNHIWWEDSPWLHSWTHGNFNAGGLPLPDFTKGLWDNTLSFFTRDSEGQRLTALRGFTFQFNPQEQTGVEVGVASPKTLWQDYAQVDNFLSATRVTHSVSENLKLGVTANTRLGYNIDDNNKLDAKNYVFGTDLGYEIIDGIKTDLEFVHSQSGYDLTNSQYQTKTNGNAYYFSVLGRFPLNSIMDTKYGYEGIEPKNNEGAFTKFRFFAAEMEHSFDNSLSSYVETRDDESWSRHLHFRKPFKYYYQGEGQLLSWDDVKPFAIGNGIDIGRKTLGLRIESLLFDKKVDNLFDVRNVHDTNNKFIENVGRDQFTWNINDRLTSKFLGIYQRLPKTKAGFDPFVFDPQTRRFFVNDQIEDGKDPSIATGSLGLEYKFFDWLALNGIWEYTNDISLAYDNFPRGIFNTGTQSFISFDQNGNRYRDVLNSLYSQQFFPKPPYPYYNIFKTGLRLNPMEKLEVYLDYTRNAYEKAGQFDDNMNHIAFEVSYAPMPKLKLFLKYSYSRWQDLDKLQNGIAKLFGHHNVFTELVYNKSADEDFTFQYGEASRDPYMGGVLDIGWDPYGGSLRTIDTQHIFRIYYRRKF